MSSKNNKQSFIGINKIWRESYNTAMREERYLSKKKAKEDIYLGFSIFFATYAILYALYFLLYFKKSNIAGKLIYEIIGLLITSINIVLSTSAVWFIVPLALYLLINLLIKNGNIKKLFYIVLMVVFFLAMPSLKVDKKTILNIKDLIDNESYFNSSKMVKYVVAPPLDIISTFRFIKKLFLLSSVSFDLLKNLTEWYGDLFVWLSQIIVFLRMTLGGYLSVTVSAVFSFFLTLSVAIVIMPIQYTPGSDSFVPVAQGVLNSTIYIYTFIILNSIGVLLKGFSDLIIVSLKGHFHGKTQKRKAPISEEKNNKDENDKVANEGKRNENKDDNVTKEEKINEDKNDYVTNKQRNKTSKYYILIISVITIIFLALFLRGEIPKKSLPVTIKYDHSWRIKDIIEITNETDYTLYIECDIIREGKLASSRIIKLEAKKTENIGDSFYNMGRGIMSGDKIIFKNNEYKDKVINIP